MKITHQMKDQQNRQMECQETNFVTRENIMKAIKNNKPKKLGWVGQSPSTNLGGGYRHNFKVGKKVLMNRIAPA